jgi:pyruvyl transferase EpsO
MNVVSGAAALATNGAPDANAELLSSLATKIEQVVTPLVPADRPVALLDFPTSPNVGDSAIWLGTMSYLERRGIRPVYMSSYHTFSASALERRIGNGTILLTGGGNFGDLYPPHQVLREEVVQRFPRHRIVQLPQTVYFQSHDALERARRVFDSHPDVTLLVRDRASLERARAHFRAPSHLCPDMALVLGPQARPKRRADHVVWLSRADKETPPPPHAEPPTGVHAIDWLNDDRTVLWRLHRRIGRVMRGRPGLRELLQGPLSRTYAPLARERLERGHRMLGAGQVVITNRLHAHILCLLLGTPHVLLDNSYGKVRDFYDTWTHVSPLVEWGANEPQAISRALEMLAKLMTG